MAKQKMMLVLTPRDQGVGPVIRNALIQEFGKGYGVLSAGVDITDYDQSSRADQWAVEMVQAMTKGHGTIVDHRAMSVGFYKLAKFDWVIALSPAVRAFLQEAEIPHVYSDLLDETPPSLDELNAAVQKLVAEIQKAA